LRRTKSTISSSHRLRSFRGPWKWLTLAVFLVAVFLPGCSPARSTRADNGRVPSTPIDGDWITVRYESDPDTLNPINAATANARNALFGSNWSQVYETLLQYDPANRWMKTKGLLAESYPEISPDHLSYTFTIRDGIQWHDSHPFTAEDVVFSAKAILCPGVDDGVVRSDYADLVGAEILDHRKVRFTVKRPYYQNATQLGALPIVPKHIFDPDGLLDSLTLADIINPKNKTNPSLNKFAKQFNQHPNNRSPIGTGPYKFEKWETAQEIVLVKNTDYWGQKAYLDKIVFRIIQDYTAALAALKSGEIDFQPRLSTIQYAQQTSGPAFEQTFAKVRYPYPSYYYIGWNHERLFFKDKRVRQALTMLLDRQQIIDTIRFGLATICSTAEFRPESPDFNSRIKAWPYNPRHAAELLDAAGWTDHDGDGLRDKDGVAFRFNFVAASPNPLADQLLPVVKDTFRKAGIEVNIQRLEFAVLVNTLRDHRFDAALGSWVADLESDPYEVWHSSQSADRGSNFVSFKNAEADTLIERARMEFDAEKRRALYWRLQEILHDEQPYTFLFYPLETAAFDKRFQNVAFVPARPGYDLNTWFVPRAAQRYGSTDRQ
jgi:peptide/nickel transport system substrate-binding protein